MSVQERKGGWYEITQPDGHVFYYHRPSSRRQWERPRHLTALSTGSGSELLFPLERLGPFQVLDRVDFKMEVDRDHHTYTVTPLNANDTMPSSLPSRIGGKLSRVARINLDEPARQRACIPRDAVEMAWAYPCLGSEPDRVPATASRDHRRLAFLRIGGFVYFDDLLNVVRINSVAIGAYPYTGGISFSGPYVASSAALGIIDLHHTLAEVTDAAVRATGALRFAWLPPNGDREARLPVSAPYGAFVYEYENDQHRYFAIEPRSPAGDLPPSLAAGHGRDDDEDGDPLRADERRSSLFLEYVDLLKSVQLLPAPFRGEPIGRGDALIVVDMQNDFMPGGAFGVADGDKAELEIVKLMRHTAEQGGRIVATRDYHPRNHVSFAKFPPHCLQGSRGSDLSPLIAKELTGLRQLSSHSDVHVVFKGFHPDVDSFGSFPYTEEYAQSRELSCVHGCPMSWTGCFELQCSNDDTDINAPPDILSWELPGGRKPLAEVIGPKSTRLFVCGLALDFCVLDTAITARFAGYEKVFIVVDASRAAYVEGTFITPVEQIRDKLHRHGISLVPVAGCLPQKREPT